MSSVRIITGDCREALRALPADSVHAVVTSPPYFGLRDYNAAGQLGLEPALDCGAWARSWYGDGEPPVLCGACFVCQLLGVFREVRRVLRPDGLAWVNLGDSYGRGERVRWHGDRERHGKGDQLHTRHKTAGGGYGASSAVLPKKQLNGAPWRFAFAMQADGWKLRQDVIWHKLNPMPESTRDRCTVAHEYLFVFARSLRYYFDAEAIAEEASTNSHRRGNGGGANGKTQARKPVAGWARGGGAHSALEHATTKGEERGADGLRDGTKFGREPGWRERRRNNDSYHDGNRCDLVERRNKRSVWPLTSEPYKGAHFATFPTRLVEPCIAASTSERGACASCGAPFVRRVVRHKAMAGNAGERGTVIAGKGTDGAESPATGRAKGADVRGGPVVASQTVGWKPSCTCPAALYAQPVPCTVLDPFGGAGTVGLVAARLQRSAILVELNPGYAAMAERRIHDDAPLLAARPEPQKNPEAGG